MIGRPIIYMLSSMPGVYRLEIHSGQIWKQLRPDHEVAQALVRSFQHRRARNRYRHIIETSHRLPHIGKHIVRGKLYPSKPFGAYRSPFLSGPTLQEASHLETMSLCERVQCLIALSSISTALRAFVHTQGYLIGDWTLHNMIWHERTDTIYKHRFGGILYLWTKGTPSFLGGKGSESSESFMPINTNSTTYNTFYATYDPSPRSSFTYGNTPSPTSAVLCTLFS